jgi:hypothetical protein
VVQHGFGNADTGYAGDRIASAVNMTYRTRFGRPATASTWPAQTALSTRLPIDHRSSIQVGLSIDCFAHRVALVLPRAGRTTFLRQVGHPSRSSPSTTPLRSAIQHKPECCLRVPVPGLRSFLAPHPDRSHQGSPITPRRTTGAERYAHRALSVPPCGRFARCLLTSVPFKSPHSPTAISPCAPQYKPERGVQSVRCEARTALISHRADSTPPHLSAPGTGAQTATLRLVMEPALKGQVPRQGYASRPSVSILTPYGPRRFKGPFGSPLIVPLPANKAGRLILVISISL